MRSLNDDWKKIVWIQWYWSSIPVHSLGSFDSPDGSFCFTIFFKYVQYSAWRSVDKIPKLQAKVWFNWLKLRTLDSCQIIVLEKVSLWFKKNKFQMWTMAKFTQHLLKVIKFQKQSELFPRWPMVSIKNKKKLIYLKKQIFSEWSSQCVVNINIAWP